MALAVASTFICFVKVQYATTPFTIHVYLSHALNTFDYDKYYRPTHSDTKTVSHWGYLIII